MTSGISIVTAAVRKSVLSRKVGVLTDYSRQKALAKASAFCNEAAPDGADEAMKPLR